MPAYHGNATAISLPGIIQLASPIMFNNSFIQHIGPFPDGQAAQDWINANLAELDGADETAVFHLLYQPKE